MGFGLSQADGLGRLVLLLSVLLPVSLLPAAHAQSASASPALDDVVSRAQEAQTAGRYAEAAKVYAQATAINPAIPELWANRGLMEHLAGQPATAISSFQHALAAKPKLFTALLFTGIDYAALNQPQQAVPYLDRALRLQPTNPDALVALSSSLTSLGRLDQAASALETAVRSAPANTGAWFALATTRLAVIDRDGGRLARRFTRSAWAQALYAEELLLQGRTGEAVDTFRQAVANASPRQRSIFAAILLARRQPADLSAQGFAQGSAQGSPQGDVSPEALDRVLAIVQPANAPASAPCPATDSSASRSAAAGIACGSLQGDATQAASAAAAGLLARPDDPEALFWSVKANERRSVEALAEFQRLAPQSAATFDLLGDLYRRRLQPDRALEEYTRALVADAHDRPALLGSAAAYLATGRPELAVSTTRSALTDRPEDPRLNLLMGEALVMQHHFTDARPFVEHALAGATTDARSGRSESLLPSAHALLGQIKADAGDLAGAIADLTLGLPSDSDGSLSFQLSRLYRRQGQKAEAEQAEAHARALLADRRSRAVTAVNNSLEATP